MVEQPRHESVKNGAGVACIPELRAALRLKTFEAWPDAKSSVPVTGVKFGRTGLPATAANVVQAPNDAELGSLVQERLAARQQRCSTCCAPVRAKESAKNRRCSFRGETTIARRGYGTRGHTKGANSFLELAPF